jgi:CHAT domain-containing protein
VHVAAQVVTNDPFPDLSRIRVGDVAGRRYSGDVFVRDLTGAQSVRAGLVILEKGAGAAITPTGEGSLGVARALLAAGVANVVTPVADLESSSVEGTWLEFHRSYASGEDAVESLRRAQLTALGESNRRPGPWATLTVFGSAQ